MSLSPPRDRQFSLKIEWKNTTVQLQARIVRSEQRPVQLESAAMRRTEYNVALEFIDLTSEAAAAVRRILHE